MASFVLAIIALIALFPVAYLFAIYLEFERIPTTIWSLGLVFSMLALIFSQFGENEKSVGSAGEMLSLTGLVIYFTIGIIMLIIR